MARRMLVLVVLTVLLAGCSGGNDSAESGEFEGAAQDLEGAAQDLEGASAGTEVAAEEAEAAGDDAADGGGAAREVAPGSTDLGTLLPVSTGDRIIKDGTVTVEVAADTFDRAFEQVVTVAARLDGTVVATSSRSRGDEGPTGSVTVRVPVDAYEQLLVGVRDIGDVRGERVTSQDVGVEYVDLQARLRQQQAQERFYLGLLEEAEDIDDAIAVQQRLTDIQTEIERLTGRLQFLDDRTAYSTLTVEIVEPGSPPVATGPREPTLATYWAQARRSLVAVIGTMLVVGTALLPLLVPVAVALGAWRLSRRRPTADLPS